MKFCQGDLFQGFRDIAIPTLNPTWHWKDGGYRKNVAGVPFATLQTFVMTEHGSSDALKPSFVDREHMKTDCGWGLPGDSTRIFDTRRRKGAYCSHFLLLEGALFAKLPSSILKVIMFEIA